MIKKTIDALHKLLLILNPSQKILGVTVVVGSLISAVLELAGVSVIVPLVNMLLAPEQLMQNSYVVIITDFLGVYTYEGLIALVVSFVIAVYIVKNLFLIFYSWMRNKYACKIQRECSVYMMQSYMNRGYDFFLNRNVNEIRQGIEGDVASLYQTVSALLQIITQLITAMLICIYMCYKDWRIALGVILSATVCLILVFAVFRPKMIQTGIQSRIYAIRSGQTLLQAFQGIKEVLVARKQKFFIKEYEENVSKRQEALIIQNIGVEIPAYVIEMVCVTGIMAILGIRMADMPESTDFVATLASFVVGAFRILPALGKISASGNTVSAGIPGINAVCENIVEARSYNDTFYNIEAADDKCYENKKFEQSIRISNLSFSYIVGQKKILDNLNLEIPKGRSVAFVGESGAGKSTLADLILGVLTPNEGEILMDGINIRRIPNLWSRLIGYVPQSIYLSDASICRNVAFGVEERDIEEEKVIDALKEAELFEFVQGLPKGIHTGVGDRGVRISGGQRQRIGIARALYFSPEILVLDEATSALDNETERSVMDAIDSLHGKVTLIIIAHRLTTIKNSDVIYEIMDGKAVKRVYEELV